MMTSRMKKKILAAAALAGLVLLVGVTAEAQLPAPAKKVPALNAAIARHAKVKVADVDKMLKAFGPAFAEQLAAGREVNLPGVGLFRVVRVDEYKDLVNGRPATIPAKNYVEFIPDGQL